MTRIKPKRKNAYQQWTKFIYDEQATKSYRSRIDAKESQVFYSEIFTNKSHCVIVTPMSIKHQMDGWVSLSVKRHDRKAECDWRIFQRIKNDLVGEKREAVQLFPSMDRVLDTANQYFLWVAPKNYIFGIGQVDQEVSDENYAEKVGSVQRPFADSDPLGKLVDNGDRSKTVGQFPLPVFPEGYLELMKVYFQSKKQGMESNDNFDEEKSN